MLGNGGDGDFNNQLHLGRVVTGNLRRSKLINLGPILVVLSDCMVVVAVGQPNKRDLIKTWMAVGLGNIKLSECQFN